MTGDNRKHNLPFFALMMKEGPIRFPGPFAFRLSLSQLLPAPPYSDFLLTGDMVRINQGDIPVNVPHLLAAGKKSELELCLFKL